MKIAFVQFAHARTIYEYGATMIVSRVRVTSQIHIGDVTMLSQKRPSLRNEWSMIAFSRIMYWGHKIACIHSLTSITIFVSRVMRFANSLTRDPKIVIHGNSSIILYNIWDLIIRQNENSNITFCTLDKYHTINHAQVCFTTSPLMG